MEPAEDPQIGVDVAYAPRQSVVDLVTLRLSAGSTATQALAASGLLERHGLTLAGLRLGIWGKVREADTVLREGDRVEVYRPLLVDPKEARRQRYQQHKESVARRASSKKATGTA